MQSLELLTALEQALEEAMPRIRQAILRTHLQAARNEVGACLVVH